MYLISHPSFVPPPLPPDGQRAAVETAAKTFYFGNIFLIKTVKSCGLFTSQSAGTQWVWPWKAASAVHSGSFIFYLGIKDLFCLFFWPEGTNFQNNTF